MQQNSNNRSFKIITVIALCVAVLCLSVAYAALTQKLTIDGEAEVQAATWDVQMIDFKKDTGVTVTSETGTTVTGLKFTFDKPNQEKTYKFTIKNLGTIDATLNGFAGGLNDATLKCTGTDETDKTSACGAENKGGSVQYKIEVGGVDVTSEGYSAITQTDLPTTLEEGVAVVVTVSYKPDNNTLIKTADVTVELPTISFDYGQKA